MGHYQCHSIFLNPVPVGESASNWSVARSIYKTAIDCDCAKGIAGIAQEKFPGMEANVRNYTVPLARAGSHIFFTASVFVASSANDKSIELTTSPKYSIT